MGPEEEEKKKKKKNEFIWYCSQKLD